MNTKDRIKAAIKKAGYNLRQVSVKEKRSLLNEVFEICIRDANVDYNKIIAIEKDFRSVSYCEASGEMLQGANTFISVNIALPVLEKWAEKYKWIIEEMMEESNGEGFRLGRFDIMIPSHNVVRVYDRDRQKTLPMHYHPQNTLSLSMGLYLAEIGE